MNAGWDTSRYAIVVTNKSYHDALAASGLAGLLNCPILMTDKASLTGATSNLIKNKGVKNVIIAGGISAVSDNVSAQIKEPVFRS